MLDKYQVLFNNVLLDSPVGAELYNHDFTKLPRRDVKMYKIAHRDKSIITSGEYTSKDVLVYIDVCSGSRQDTEASLQQLRAITQAQNGLLQVLQAGTITQYTATLNEFNTTWNGSNAYCQLVFTASDPIGEATDVTVMLNETGITTGISTYTFNVLGSFTAEPLITITINAVTGGTGATLNIYNATTGQGISLTRNWTAGDIIEIDCKNYGVEVNTVESDYDGIFLVLPAGVQALTQSNTFTTVDMDIYATYKKRTV